MYAFPLQLSAANGRWGRWACTWPSADEAVRLMDDAVEPKFSPEEKKFAAAEAQGKIRQTTTAPPLSFVPLQCPSTLLPAFLLIDTFLP